MYLSTTSSQKLNKIKDLLDVNATRSVDLVGMIANIGNLQEINLNQETMRDVYLFDDSWAMVKMVVRSSLNAMEHENFEQYQILLVRNVQAIKRKDYMYLITTPGTTELIVLDNTPQAIALNQWFFGSDLLLEGFQKFFNLSSNSPIFGDQRASSSQKNSDKQNAWEKKETTNEQKIKSKGLKNGHSSSSEETSVKTKRMKPDSKSSEQKECIKINQKIKQEILSNLGEKFNQQPAEQVMLESNTEDFVKNPSTFEPNRTEVENYTTNTASNNEDNKEKCLQPEIKNELSDTNNKKVLKSELKSEVKHEFEADNQMKNQSSDSDENDLTKVNFKNLMESKFFSQKLEWSQQQDKVLINYVINNPDTNFKSSSSYDQLLKDKPQIFDKQTTESLQNRLKMLANVENYLYLLQVCGGKNLKTEKEKNSFLSNVETLRCIMGCKPKENNNAFNNFN